MTYFADSPHPNPSPEGEGLCSQFTDTAIRLSGVTALVLGWVPDVFWGATPDELGAILAAAGGLGAGGPEGDAAPPDGATIARLMEMYPDG